MDGVFYCQRKGIDSVQEIVDKLAAVGWKKLREFEQYNCNYYYGEILLVHLYEAIGEGAFRSAWRDIYGASQSRAGREAGYDRRGDLPGVSEAYACGQIG